MISYLFERDMGENKMNIEEKIKEWRDEVGEIPEATCPNIDKLIKGLTDLEDIINRADRNYDDVSTLAGDLSWAMPDYYILEDLRKDNDQLRALGGFWYERCKELITLLQQEREEAVREFVGWWGKQSLGTSIHMNNVEQFLKESEVQDE